MVELENMTALLQLMISMSIATFISILGVSIFLFLYVIIRGVIGEIKEYFYNKKRRGEWERKINGDNN